MSKMLEILKKAQVGKSLRQEVRRILWSILIAGVFFLLLAALVTSVKQEEARLQREYPGKLQAFLTVLEGVSGEELLGAEKAAVKELLALEEQRVLDGLLRPLIDKPQEMLAMLREFESWAEQVKSSRASDAKVQALKARERELEGIAPSTLKTEVRDYYVAALKAANAGQYPAIRILRAPLEWPPPERFGFRIEELKGRHLFWKANVQASMAELESG